jgi:hypothetical protein
MITFQPKIENDNKMNEEWKPVTGYAGYEVSNAGNVRKTGQTKYLKRYSGYGMLRVALRKGDDFHLIAIAKLVLEAFVSRMQRGMKPNCMDGNYENLQVTNLCWVERRQKKYKKKKYKPGKRNDDTDKILKRHFEWLQNKQQ